MKKLFSLFAILTITGSFGLRAQSLRLLGNLKEMIAGPVNPAERQLWLDSLTQWRINERKTINYDDREYRRPEFNWVKTSFIYAQMMAHERYFYDPVSNKYTVDRYLNDLKKRYGGLDAVLIWPTYPNIGVDNRNQFDLVADMPGGKEAVKQMIRDFHKRGVRVFFPIMIWDKGTRKIGEHMAKALMAEMKELGADGMNGDTMTGVTEDFKDDYIAQGYPVALQPEVNLDNLKMIEWNRLSWGYYFPDWDALRFNYSPGVSLYKWLEPRHQVDVTDRWAVDKTDDLQYTFFNGVGYNAWENIWGIWNQVPDSYAGTIRRISTIYRKFPDVWNSTAWEPYYPTVQYGVFATKFPGKGENVYTLINRDSLQRNGAQITFPYKRGVKYYDLWNGVELKPEKIKNNAVLSFNMESRGFGAVLELTDLSQANDLAPFLAKIHTIAKAPLNSLSETSQPIKQRLVPTAKTKIKGTAPDGMIAIPAIADYNFETNGVMIEGDEIPNEVGVQYPWQSHPQRAQSKTMAIDAFYIDRYPVTNRQFKQFIKATNYQPKDKHNFLKDWKNGSYPAGWDKKPVTWVSMDDARAYAAWAGKRLPHEWEWQYAAQGSDGRLYPWGKGRDTTLIPPADTTRAMREPTDVDAYPKGASQLGIMDLTGNVWQWTDEYVDDHTRSAILKGGSYYHAQTSGWYFPQAQELDKYAKYLLMSPSMDRAATIGFRCVVDR